MKLALFLLLFGLVYSRAIAGTTAFTSSNLPLIIINTNGKTIPDAYKIDASMKIISNGPGIPNKPTDPGNVYDGKIGIEIRGSYSASLPQKPYGIETRDSNGNNFDVSLLGMPAENDWILLANYNDKSFMRNTLAFDLFRKMGHYAPRTQLCEVLVNGQYQGIYVFTEKIKRDKGRVNIANLKTTDISGDDVTGGYIFKVDYYDSSNSWKSNYSPIDHPGKSVYFVYHDPKPTELVYQQKSYLKDFVNSFETTLYSNNFANPATGYQAWIDVQSFIDYFIVSEVSRNVDAFKKSEYFYKDKNSKDGRLHAGPVWDFDWAWKNIWDCYMFSQTDGSGWSYMLNDCNPWPTSPGWMVRLLQDPNFANALNQRYFELRNSYLSLNYINHYIDSVKTLVAEAQVRHYSQWPILGQNVGAPEVDAIPNSYSGEVEKLRTWITTRINWLDKNMPGQSATTIPIVYNQGLSYRLFPNPATEYVYLESSGDLNLIEFFTILGTKAKVCRVTETSDKKISVSDLPHGTYVLKMYFRNHLPISTKILIN